MSKTNEGPDGIMQIFPTIPGGTEIYMMDNPDTKKINVSYGKNSHIKYTKEKEGRLTYFNTDGYPITYHSDGKKGRSTRVDVYPDGGMWSNRTKFNWEHNPGYLYTTKGIKNGEFTTFIRVHDDLGEDDDDYDHYAYAHKIGGRDEDDLRSLVEMVFPTKKNSDIRVNYDYYHFPYVRGEPSHSSKINILFNPSELEEDIWVGVKTIHKVVSDNKSTHWEMWIDEDPFDDNGNPKNGWKKAATYEDIGVTNYKYKDKDDDNKEKILKWWPPVTWRCHKDVCRVDGYGNVDFALFSDREIDPNAQSSIKICI
jgi:hypothetical protein